MKLDRKSWSQKYLPDHVSNPFRLAKKLMSDRNPAARSAMLMAAAGLLFVPLDVLLQYFERRELARAKSTHNPVLIVVGPPRSGTTLVAQYIINALQVSYINNLTSLFPRSPITINRLLRHLVPLRAGDYEAFYGKSRGLAGANDGLYIWDRWLGENREKIPKKLGDDARQSMRRFFAAYGGLYELPVVTKVNRINTCANLVAEALGDVSFLCLHRNPLNLAQSLYIARDNITGNMRSAYGVQHTNSVSNDPVEDVCQQVVFHERQAEQQQKLLGSSKFSIISYEKFCQNPNGFIASVLTEHPSLTPRAGNRLSVNSFEISDKRRLAEPIFERMRVRLEELGANRLTCRQF